MEKKMNVWLSIVQGEVHCVHDLTWAFEENVKIDLSYYHVFYSTYYYTTRNVCKICSTYRNKTRQNPENL